MYGLDLRCRKKGSLIYYDLCKYTKYIDVRTHMLILERDNIEPCEVSEDRHCFPKWFTLNISIWINEPLAAVNTILLTRPGRGGGCPMACMYIATVFIHIQSQTYTGLLLPLDSFTANLSSALSA